MQTEATQRDVQWLLWSVNEVKRGMAWHGMRNMRRKKQADWRVSLIKICRWDFTIKMTVTAWVHGSFCEYLCSGEAPKDRQPNCIQMPWLIRAHTIRFCFISYSIKSKGRGRSNRLQSPVRITILHSNSFSSFTNHRGQPGSHLQTAAHQN